MRVSLCAIVICLFAASLRADQITLKSGVVLHGDVIAQDANSVTLEMSMPGCRVFRAIRRSDIVAGPLGGVVPMIPISPSPPIDHRSRCCCRAEAAADRKNQLEAKVTACRFAINGIYERRDEEIRQINVERKQDWQVYSSEFNPVAPIDYLYEAQRKVAAAQLRADDKASVYEIQIVEAQTELAGN